jgi:hypothetical protein
MVGVITDIVIVVAAALLIGVYVSWRAGRIDRLHARVEMARAALDVNLLRRSSVALELATSGLLDPATSLLLAAAVHGTRTDGGDRPRDLAESDLTRALRAAFSQPDFRSSLSGKEGADELLGEVEATAHQVFLARKFYNDMVAAVRQRPGPRVLRDGRFPDRRQNRRQPRPLAAGVGGGTDLLAGWSYDVDKQPPLIK